MSYVKHFVTDDSPKGKVLRWLLIAVAIAAIMLGLSQPAFAQTKYVITDGDNVIVCMSSSTDPKVVIEEAGLQLGESDTYTTQKNDGISEIHINRIQMITVQADGEIFVVGSYGGTVADVLQSLEITLSDTDILSCSPDDQTYDGMSVELTRIRREILEYDEIIPHEVQVYEDVSLKAGEERVLVPGNDGVIHYTAQILYENGVEVQREILSEQTVAEPNNGIVFRGVDRSVRAQQTTGDELHIADPEPAQINYVPGTNLTYREILDFQATAYYCPNPELWNITYTGTEVQVGTVAVDPNFIPLGTKMYIVSADGEYVYGYAIAEDTGGAIKGKIVDLYFNTYDECITFGRRDVKIYVLD